MGASCSSDDSVYPNSRNNMDTMSQNLASIPALTKYARALTPKLMIELQAAIGSMNVPVVLGGLSAGDIYPPTEPPKYLEKERHFGYLVAAELEYANLKTRNAFGIFSISFSNDALAGLLTTNEYFESVEESKEFIRCVFGSLWREDQEYAYQWEDMTSDVAISRLAFFGFASHLVRRLSESDTQKFKCEEVDATYILDVTLFSLYKVRKGFEVFGAAAFFNDRKELVGIYLSYKNEIVLPGSEDWEHAKYAWKTSAMTQVTILDHLAILHLVEANTMSIACRECLDPDHPLRRFLKAYIWRTDLINLAVAPILIGYQMIVHETFSFTFDSIYEAIPACRASYKFRPFPQIIKDNGMMDEPDDEYPLKDALPLWEIIGNWVQTYLTIYYPNGDGDLKDDKQLVDFYEELCRGLGLSQYDLSMETLREVLTQLIFAVTGGHEQYGKVLPYLGRSDYCGTRIRKGQTVCDIQAFAGAANLAVSLSGVFPRIGDDYSHLFLQDGKRDQVIEAFNRFRAELEELSQTIDAKNENRPVPFENFNPKYLECSVSI